MNPIIGAHSYTSLAWFQASSDSVLNSLLESSGDEEEGDQSRRGSVLRATRISPTADVDVGRNGQRVQSPQMNPPRLGLNEREFAWEARRSKIKNKCESPSIAGETIAQRNNNIMTTCILTTQRSMAGTLFWISRGCTINAGILTFAL